MIIAANFKTNLLRQETQEYIATLEAFVQENKVTQDVFVFPAQSSLFFYSGNVNIGAQNAYPTQIGAFTGEIGSAHLEEFGIKTILIGHSERRHILQESKELIAQKFRYYKELGYRIVFCIGEPLEVRQQGEEQMMAYLDAQLEGIDLEYENLIIAYEPVWAIGTGITPTNEDIARIHSTLRLQCKKPLLYGGSVKTTNIHEILPLPNVDGVLVGSGALHVKDFCSMIQTAQELNA
jgi:triosephosphate isomerase (TIM)